MDQMHQNPKCAHHDARRGRAGTAVAVYIESGMAHTMSDVCADRVVVGTARVVVGTARVVVGTARVVSVTNPHARSVLQ